jgi:orotidine-5'-phosphate decarboxylase
MLRAAREAAAEAPLPPRLIAVTVLTSLDEGDLAATGQRGPALDQVRRLAGLAQQAGLAGVVCSPREIGPLRADCGPDFLLVVPGIRPAGAAAGDQKRVMTPAEAATAGASALVIGRPITAATDPAAAAAAIRAELAGTADHG